MTEVVKFAPGPWHTTQAQRPPHHLMVINARGFAVGMVFKRTLADDELCFANARLIEHAPALFAACQKAAQFIQVMVETAEDVQAELELPDQLLPTANDFLAELETVIRKVEGRRP